MEQKKHFTKKLRVYKPSIRLVEHKAINQDLLILDKSLAGKVIAQAGLIFLFTDQKCCSAPAKGCESKVLEDSFVLIYFSYQGFQSSLLEQLCSFWCNYRLWQNNVCLKLSFYCQNKHLSLKRRNSFKYCLGGCGKRS